MLTLISLPVLDPILEPTLIPIPIDLEHEPPILDSHIPLLGKECKSQFFDLDSTLEPKRTLEPKLDLSQFYESALVPVPFILKLKSSALVPVPFILELKSHSIVGPRYRQL